MQGTFKQARPGRHGEAAGGELHQLAGGSHPQMTTNHGGVLADDENSLEIGLRGPVLLKEFAAGSADHRRAKPVLCGILSALLRFVPYVGLLLSALLPMALAEALSTRRPRPCWCSCWASTAWERA